MPATLTTGALVVFGLIAVALVLFVTEWLPPDITAIGVLVSLAVLAPYTGVTTGEAFDGFPFLLVVTFAAANAFVTPIGYQTNLMVYGSGGYKFTDYVRGGGPLQLHLTVVTTLSIAALWPP